MRSLFLAVVFLLMFALEAFGQPLGPGWVQTGINQWEKVTYDKPISDRMKATVHENFLAAVSRLEAANKRTCKCGGDPAKCTCDTCECNGGKSCKVKTPLPKISCGCEGANCSCGSNCQCVDTGCTCGGTCGGEGSWTDPDAQGYIYYGAGGCWVAVDHPSWPYPVTYDERYGGFGLDHPFKSMSSKLSPYRKPSNLARGASIVAGSYCSH